MRPGGNVRRNCVRGLRRVGWRRLTCGRDRNRAASAQVRAKREDLYQEVQVRGLIAGAAVGPFGRLSAARPWN